MLIPSGYAQVNFIYTGSAIPMGAEWTLGLDTRDYVNDIGQMATDVRSAYDTSDIESVIGTGCDLTGVLVKKGPNATGPSVLRAAAIISDGGTPSDSPGTCVLVHKNTAFGGRSGRGRLYLPCAPDAGVGLAGALTPTFQGQVQTRFDDLATALESFDLHPVLLHGDSSVFSSPTAIDSFTVDAQVATQRRRNRR